MIYHGECFNAVPSGLGVLTDNQGNKVMGIWSSGSYIDAPYRLNVIISDQPCGLFATLADDILALQAAEVASSTKDRADELAEQCFS